jgi:hypothetical protein
MSPEARERAFDDLATQMASGSISRGKALRLMGAALVGGTLGSLGIRGASADQGENEECKPEKKKCRKNSQCCSGNCDSSSGKCAPACPTGYVRLSNGTCAKPCTNGIVDCPGCGTGGCSGHVSGGAAYCVSSRQSCTSNTDCVSGICDAGTCHCTSDAQCPSGLFCGAAGNACLAAC